MVQPPLSPRSMVVTVVTIASMILTATGQTDYQTAGLQRHNEVRARHCNTSPLSLNADLNTRAVACASYYAGIGRIDHTCSNRGNSGENLYFSSGFTGTNSDAVRRAVDSWYNEISSYNFNSPGFNSRTGHFTQVVWRASQRLGVGYFASGNRQYIVALYDPPGNFGQSANYGTNVQRLC